MELIVERLLPWVIQQPTFVPLHIVKLKVTFPRSRLNRRRSINN